MSSVSECWKVLTNSCRKPDLYLDITFTGILFCYINVCANYYNNLELVPVTNQL